MNTPRGDGDLHFAFEIPGYGRSDAAAVALSRASRSPLARALILATMVLATAPITSGDSHLHAQIPPELPDARAHRTLALGGPVFLGSTRPAILVGGLYQVSLAPMRTVREDDLLVRRAPSWYLHLSGSAGHSFAREPDRGLLAIGSAGLVRRIQPSPVSAVGPVLLGVAGPAAWGAALRVEIADNIGVQTGWTRRARTRENRVIFSVDVLRCLLEDLGLGPCIGPSPAR